MKTAISIPDKVFHDADAYALQVGFSRSELYATAIAEYLARRDEVRITARLNAVYAAATQPALPVLPPPGRLAASRADLW